MRLMTAALVLVVTHASCGGDAKVSGYNSARVLRARSSRGRADRHREQISSHEGQVQTGPAQQATTLWCVTAVPLCTVPVRRRRRKRHNHAPETTMPNVSATIAYRPLMPAIATRLRRKPSKLLAVHSRFGRVADQAEALVAARSAGPRSRTSCCCSVQSTSRLICKHTHAFDRALLRLGDAHRAHVAGAAVVLGQAAVMIFEIGQCQRGPMRLRLVADHRAGRANLARAAVIDDAVLACLRCASPRRPAQSFPAPTQARPALSISAIASHPASQHRAHDRRLAPSPCPPSA